MIAHVRHEHPSELRRAQDSRQALQGFNAQPRFPALDSQKVGRVHISESRSLPEAEATRLS